jgi:hypothetical protein
MRHLSPREELFRKELVDELRRVEAMIRQEPSVEKKIYYFSAAYGITSRTYKYSFSKEILLTDLILQGAYNMLTERLQLLKSGDKNVIPEPLIFDKICDGLKALADGFESGSSIYEPLEAIITAGFAITGPGNYLREKGDLKL